MLKSMLRSKKIISLVLTILMICAITHSATAATTIRDMYNANGSYTPTMTAAVDSAGERILIFHPKNMTGGHPIVVFSTGSKSVVSDQNVYDYQVIINKLVTWGYVVVANTNPHQYNGTRGQRAGQYMIAQNTNTTSKFYGKLDTGKIIIMGHSEGAGSSTNIIQRKLLPNIKALICLSMVSEASYAIYTMPGYVPDTSKLGGVPVFFIDGSTENDFLSSPATQNGWYTKAVSVGNPAVEATIVGEDHIWCQKTPNCGYIIAFLQYIVRGDTTAKTAFVGTNPEIKTNPSYMTQVKTNNLK